MNDEQIMGSAAMLKIIEQSSLCCDVFQNGNYIGEIVLAEDGKWGTNITIKSSVSTSEYKKIADKLDEMNK